MVQMKREIIRQWLPGAGTAASVSCCRQSSLSDSSLPRSASLPSLGTASAQWTISRCSHGGICSQMHLDNTVITPQQHCQLSFSRGITSLYKIHNKPMGNMLTLVHLENDWSRACVVGGEEKVSDVEAISSSVVFCCTAGFWHLLSVSPYLFVSAAVWVQQSHHHLPNHVAFEFFLSL